ncbi:MAG: hypothetical protein EB121_03665 [Alphaproteobacteria bacterium]|nr:hypothetical protein [Alphaproteobacteria bacterium]NDG04431.1 hypothetical protein [Alphaproteobacteria bacterium]
MRMAVRAPRLHSVSSGPGPARPASAAPLPAALLPQPQPLWPWAGVGLLAALLIINGWFAFSVLQRPAAMPHPAGIQLTSLPPEIHHAAETETVRPPAYHLQVRGGTTTTKATPKNAKPQLAVTMTKGKTPAPQGPSLHDMEAAAAAMPHRLRAQLNLAAMYDQIGQEQAALAAYQALLAQRGSPRAAELLPHEWRALANRAVYLMQRAQR